MGPPAGGVHHAPVGGYRPGYALPYNPGYRGIGLGPGYGGFGYGGLGYGGYGLGYGGYGLGGLGYGSRYSSLGYGSGYGYSGLAAPAVVVGGATSGPAFQLAPAQPLNALPLDPAPSDPNPQPLPLPAPGAAVPATVIVIASEGATVSFDGIDNTQTGTRHSFTTRPIEAGVEKRVSVKVDGPGGPATVTVAVRGGERATIDMRK